MTRNFLNTATEAAKEAGKLLLDYYGTTTKSFKHDQSVLTEADLKADKLITSIILDKFPSHSIISEESGCTIKESEFLWIIDPLDGSTNFSVCNPFFAVSIGLLYKRQPLIGVVYSPIQNELFVTKKNKGAYLNDNLINVDIKATLEKSFISFCNGRDSTSRKKIIQIYKRIKMKNNVIRHLGAPSLQLSYVASGRFGVFIMPGINSYDIVAGALIVQEANGTVTDFHNNPFTLDSSNILASSPSIHQKLSRILSQILDQ
ncbi:MAG: inositol monophosphatase family protein [Candidatus Hodarchaeota archaeon]